MGDALEINKPQTTLTIEDIYRQSPDILGETTRGIEEYARSFGCTREGLQEFLSRKRVMDLGSGFGIFAAEMALYGQLHGYPAQPISVDSVNIVYAASDYVNYKNERFQESTLRESEEPATEAQVRQAWDKAREGFKPWDWRDLSFVPSEQYDVILSCFAFPYYSDFRYLKPESQYEEQHMIEQGSFIEFGSDSKQVLTELVRVLKANGVMLLTTSFPFSSWERSPRIQGEFYTFFENLGCSASVFPVDADGRDCYIKVSKNDSPSEALSHSEI